MSCVVALMVAALCLGSQSPARGQSTSSPTATSVPTPDPVDILVRSFVGEAALKTVHADWHETKNGSADLHAVGDCINHPASVRARFRLTGYIEPSGVRHHLNLEVVVGNNRILVRSAGKRGRWKAAASLSYLNDNNDLFSFVSGVCPFLQIPLIQSQIPPVTDPYFSDFVSYEGESVIRGRAVWLLSIDFTADQPGECGCSDVQRLTIDKQTLFWVAAPDSFTSPGFGYLETSADYSRFNRPITIRLPKIGSTTP
jgi:hypothetical protein